MAGNCNLFYMIDNTRPSFSSIEIATGSLVGTVTYNSAAAYNSSLVYGGFSGGIGPGPKNYFVNNTKPNL